MALYVGSPDPAPAPKVQDKAQKKADAATTTSPGDMSTIELDHKCLQCNNVPEQVVKLFKLACLNYN
jgi:hypothetical protein